MITALGPRLGLGLRLDFGSQVWFVQYFSEKKVIVSPGSWQSPKKYTRGVTSQFPADFWFDMTDGAGNCATARASLSLEDLENEMRRAIPRPVHHNEFFSQRWAIFAPPLFFARLPAIRSAPQRGRTAKVKALLGRVLSEGQLRHQAQQPSTSLRRGAARGLCGGK